MFRFARARAENVVNGIGVTERHIRRIYRRIGVPYVGQCPPWRYTSRKSREIASSRHFDKASIEAIGQLNGQQFTCVTGVLELVADDEHKGIDPTPCQGNNDGRGLLAGFECEMTAFSHV